MPKSDENKTYASCHNPHGALSLPVGQVWIKTTEGNELAMFADSITGYDLNYLFENYENIIQVEFRSPTGSEIVYRAF